MGPGTPGAPRGDPHRLAAGPTATSPLGSRGDRDGEHARRRGAAPDPAEGAAARRLRRHPERRQPAPDPRLRRRRTGGRSPGRGARWRPGTAVVAVASRDPVHAADLAGRVGARAVPSAFAAMRAAEITFLTVPDAAVTGVAASVAATRRRPARAWRRPLQRQPRGRRGGGAPGHRRGRGQPAPPPGAGRQRVGPPAPGLPDGDRRRSRPPDAAPPPGPRPRRPARGAAGQCPGPVPRRRRPGRQRPARPCSPPPPSCSRPPGSDAADRRAGACWRSWRGPSPTPAGAGPRAALTGPLVRGDAATVAAHLAALRGPAGRRRASTAPWRARSCASPATTEGRSRSIPDLLSSGHREGGRGCVLSEACAGGSGYAAEQRAPSASQGARTPCRREAPAPRPPPPTEDPTCP